VESTGKPKRTTTHHESRRSRLSRLVLAVLLGCSFWLWRTVKTNPVEIYETTVNVTVTGLEAEKNVEAGTEPSSVRVILRGRRSELAPLRSGQGLMRATVPLNGTTSRSGVSGVTVTVPFSDIVVDSVAPSEVTYAVRELDTKKVPVRVRVIPSRSPGTPEPQASPDKVDVKGDKSAVERIVAVVAVVREEDLLSRGWADSLVRPVDAYDLYADGPYDPKVEIKPASVRVQIQLENVSPTVEVTPELTGLPANGYTVEGYSVSPTRVQVSGTREALATMAGHIPTEPIDLSGRMGSFDAKVSLRPPDGVTPIGRNTVTVTVRIAKQ